MKPESQRIAMARLDGYCVKRDDSHGNFPFLMIDPKGEESHSDYAAEDAPWRHEDLPDYLSDLNAVALVAGKLPPEKRFVYQDTLVMMLDGTSTDAIDATAAQRVEAILRATGKWEET